MEAKTVLNERKMSNYIDQGLKDTYGHGQCASLAMAVLEHLKLPCVVFYKTDPSDDSAIHVANAVDGGFLDIYGIVTHADLEKRYGCELRAVYDLKGEDTSIQFEVCMGQWTDDENDPYGAKRAWKDCGAEMRRNVQGPSGEFVRDGKVGESSVMTIIDLKNSYLDAAADLRAKQADLANHADELHRFIAVRDQLQAHPDFSGYLPETYYSGGDLDPVGAKPEHEARHSSPSPGM